MLIEILTPLISNGTTAFRTGYQPWLPFYNFVPLILVAGFALSILTGSIFWGVNFTVSSVFSVIPTWGAWRALSLDPTAVFIVWGINTAFLVWFQCYMITVRKLRMKNIRAGEPHDHSMNDYDSPEEYLQHIKTAHPDIWKKYHEEKEE